MAVSAKLLVELADKHDTAACRQLARLIIEGRVEQSCDIRKAIIYLLGAALSADRKAGWLLCKYYLMGAKGFEKDIAMARHWRDRTERRLRSDARLLYDDPALEAEAIKLYGAWRRWLDRHWPESLEI